MVIRVFKHASIKIDNIYFDPYKIDKEFHDAEYVFITHSHYDHFSIEDIKKVCNNDTIIVAPHDVIESLNLQMKAKIIQISEYSYFETDSFKVTTFPSYNIGKEFHKREENWVGYVLEYKGKTFAILGDTDATPEVLKLKCDILFVPIGGKYTMNAVEAARAVNHIKPKTVIPIHYNLLVGTQEDKKMFIKAVNSNIECITYF